MSELFVATFANRLAGNMHRIKDTPGSSEVVAAHVLFFTHSCSVPSLTFATLTQIVQGAH